MKYSLKLIIISGLLMIMVVNCKRANIDNFSELSEELFCKDNLCSIFEDTLRYVKTKKINTEDYSNNNVGEIIDMMVESRKIKSITIAVCNESGTKKIIGAYVIFQHQKNYDMIAVFCLNENAYITAVNQIKDDLQQDDKLVSINFQKIKKTHDFQLKLVKVSNKSKPMIVPELNVKQ